MADHIKAAHEWLEKAERDYRAESEQGARQGLLAAEIARAHIALADQARKAVSRD